MEIDRVCQDHNQEFAGFLAKNHTGQRVAAKEQSESVDNEKIA